MYSALGGLQGVPCFFHSIFNPAQAKSASDASAESNLMLLRATRAARVGARAGRLTRVVSWLGRGQNSGPHKGGHMTPARDATQSLFANQLEKS